MWLLFRHFAGLDIESYPWPPGCWPWVFSGTSRHVFNFQGDQITGRELEACEDCSTFFGAQLLILSARFLKFWGTTLDIRFNEEFLGKPHRLGFELESLSRVPIHVATDGQNVPFIFNVQLALMWQASSPCLCAIHAIRLCIEGLKMVFWSPCRQYPASPEIRSFSKDWPFLNAKNVVEGVSNRQ